MQQVQKAYGIFFVCCFETTWSLSVIAEKKTCYLHKMDICHHVNG